MKTWCTFYKQTKLLFSNWQVYFISLFKDPFPNYSNGEMSNEFQIMVLSDLNDDHLHHPTYQEKGKYIYQYSANVSCTECHIGTRSMF